MRWLGVIQLEMVNNLFKMSRFAVGEPVYEGSFEDVVFITRPLPDQVTSMHHNLWWQTLQNVIEHHLLRSNSTVSEGCLHLCKPQRWNTGQNGGSLMAVAAKSETRSPMAGSWFVIMVQEIT